MKKILLLVMAMMLSFSAMCFASDGADLDAEAKIVDQFLSGKDYKKVVGYMDPEWAKNFSEEQYKNMFASMDKELGKLVEKDLRVFQMIKDGNIRLVNVKNQDAVTKVLDMVPDFVNKFTSGKKSDPEVDKAVNDILDGEK